MEFKVENLKYQYTKSNSFLFNRLSFDVTKNNIICVIGKNGSGKSTLLSILAGIKTPLTGGVYYEKKEIHLLDIKERAKKIAFLPSQNTCSENIKIIDLVLLGRYPHKNWFENYKKEDYEIALHALEQVDMVSYAKKRIFSISKGELQRVMLARILTTKSPVMIIDEPLIFLDMKQIDNFMEVLIRIKSKTITILSLHQINIVQNYADYVILLGASNKDNYIFGKKEKILNFDLLSDVFSMNVEKINKYFK